MDEVKRTYAAQLAALNEPPAENEIVKATQYKPAHMPGSIVEHKLNAIFGPENWGVDIVEWPTLVADIGTSPFFVGKYVLWVKFAGGEVARRPAIGWIAAQPNKGGGVGDIKFSNVQMAMEGCLTEGIKFGASLLGPALGLGMHNETAQALMWEHEAEPVKWTQGDQKRFQSEIVVSDGITPADLKRLLPELADGKRLSDLGPVADVIALVRERLAADLSAGGEAA